jgi:hypothetical protein
VLSATSLLASDAGGWGSIPNEVIIVIAISIMALDAAKFYLSFNSLHVFILFIPLFAFERERGVLFL